MKTYTNNTTSNFWEEAISATQFEENGLWGLKSLSGEILLPNKYERSSPPILTFGTKRLMRIIAEQ